MGPVQILTISHPIQHPANAFGKATENDPYSWAPIPMRYPEEVPGFCLAQPQLMWSLGGNQQMKAHFVSPTFSVTLHFK